MASDEAALEERLANQRVMENPHLWPKAMTPHLPVKCPKKFGQKNSQQSAFGVLYKDYESGGWILWIGHGPTRKEKRYKTIKQILDLGWVVD